MAVIDNNTLTETLTYYATTNCEQNGQKTSDVYGPYEYFAGDGSERFTEDSLPIDIYFRDGPLFSIFKIYNVSDWYDEAVFGNHTDGSGLSSDDRPSSLNRSVVYYRQASEQSPESIVGTWVTGCLVFMPYAAD